MASDLIEVGEYAALTKRSITKETCEKFGYTCGTLNGKPVQIAPYHDSTGNLVAQHVRFHPKDFAWFGLVKSASLWGQHLWRDAGKMVVITEGEIDAMTISQLQGNKWPVVSIKSGAAGARKDVAGALEWLNQFESVIFAFDMDDPGRKAAQDCAEILPPGKAKIWSIPLKDANEMLVAGRGKEVIDALWGAKVFRPDGIISAADAWDLVIEDGLEASSIPYPWQGLTEKTHGLRRSELVTVCAGSGIGKSQFCREIAAHLINNGERVGYIALEESVQRSVRGLVSIFVEKPVHIPEVRKLIPREHLAKAWERIKDAAYFYDHWGSTDGDNLVNRIRYLSRGCECHWIVLDHLSIVVSGDGEGDERRKIDNTMTMLRSLVNELGIGMILVSHLKGVEGKSHEEGAATSLNQLRGSRAIGQLSDIVIGLERNQQDVENANRTTIRVLKNRFTGETGVANDLSYNPETGRLLEATDTLFQNEQQGESYAATTTTEGR